MILVVFQFYTFDNRFGVGMKYAKPDETADGFVVGQRRVGDEQLGQFQS
jgi:hypothetical protein